MSCTEEAFTIRDALARGEQLHEFGKGAAFVGGLEQVVAMAQLEQLKRQADALETIAAFCDYSLKRLLKEEAEDMALEERRKNYK